MHAILWGSDNDCDGDFLLEKVHFFRIYIHEEFDMSKVDHWLYMFISEGLHYAIK